MNATALHLKYKDCVGTHDEEVDFRPVLVSMLAAVQRMVGRPALAKIDILENTEDSGLGSALPVQKHVWNHSHLGLHTYTRTALRVQ
jgi:hypothetical protein